MTDDLLMCLWCMCKVWLSTTITIEFSKEQDIGNMQLTLWHIYKYTNTYTYIHSKLYNVT